MLDIIYTVFQTIIHGISTILNMIISIPTYLGYVGTWVSLMPSAILLPLTIVLSASAIIAIKRLVL